MPYSFPILDKQDILVNLTELDVELSEQDLVKPSMEAIKPVYEQIVQVLTATTREELQQPVFSAIDVLEFPELHEESIGQLAFNRAVTKLLLFAGVHDFTLQDLYKPEYNRTIRNLSAIINFAKFREEKFNAFADFQERSDSLLERRAQLEEANISLTSELKQIEAARAAQEPMVRRLEAETEQLSAQIAALNKEQALLQAQVRTLKQTGTELSDKVANEKFGLLNAKEEGTRLKSEIVESPEKLQLALEDLNVQLERERGSITDAERRARELQSKLECTAKVERDVQKCLAMMQEAEAAIGKHKAVSKSVKACKSQIAANEETMALLAANQEHLKRQGAASGERMQRVQKAGRMKADEAAVSLARAKQERAETETQHAMALHKVAAKNKEIRSIHADMEDIKAQHEKATSALVMQFNALYRQVTKYHASLAQAMEEPPPMPPRPILC